MAAGWGMQSAGWKGSGMTATMGDIDEASAEAGVPELDMSKVEAFGEQMMGILNSGMTANMMSIGHQVGLFDAMAGLDGHATSEQIADDWTRLTFGPDAIVVSTINRMLLGSRETSRRRVSKHSLLPPLVAIFFPILLRRPIALLPEVAARGEQVELHRAHSREALQQFHLHRGQAA